MLSFVTPGAMCSLITLLLTFLVCADSVYSNSVHYHIRPSENVTVENPCPVDFCLTLAEFAADTTSYIGNETNITLSFLPGNHNLDRELYLPHADNFSMIKIIGGNGTVFVECISQSGRLNIIGSEFAAIKGLHFVGCGGNGVSQVEQFIVEDTTFEGVEGRGTALMLNEVIAASIERSSFLSNTHIVHPTPEIFNDQDILNYIYQDRNSSLAVGGALYAASSNVLVVNSEFTDNAADIGGALFAHNSSLHVLGSTYSNNQAGYGGVMTTSESSINIDSSTFTDNAAEVHGGVVITYQDSFSISDSTFSNNCAVNWSGGVLYAYNSTSNITSSSFIYNEALNGGVMYTHSSLFIITSSIFTNNTANGRGGVVSAYSGSSFNITSSAFNDNTARSGGVLDASDSSLDVTGSAFTNNSAYVGGVVYVLADSLFDITSSNYFDNTARYGGVMYYASRSSFNVTSSHFMDNSATSVGGVMYASNLRASFIASSTFTNNHAVYLSGGVLYAYDSSFGISSSSFADNNAANTGGVLYVFSGSSIDIISSTFSNNTATRGGVLYASDSLLDITSSNFSDNSVAEYGGVMYASRSSFNVASSHFLGNGGAENGGVMYTSDSSFDIASSTFTNNSATSIGGVMYALNSRTSFIADSTFANNLAVSLSGVLYASRSLFSIDSSFFMNNRAQYGGVLLTFYSSFSITSSDFTDNSAVSYGGVIYVFRSSFDIISSTFTDNNAAYIGGVMYAPRCSSDITNSNFFNNSAEYGGVIYAYLSSFNISTGIFMDNVASDRGGVVYLSSLSNFSTARSSYERNSAIIGGVIFTSSDGRVNITSSMFANNSAVGGASGVRADSYGGIMSIFGCTIQITNGTFEDNLGSLYVFNSNLSFSGVTVFVNGEDTLNKISTDATFTRPEGGAITSLLSTMTFTGFSTLSNNQARSGGAILATESKIILYDQTTIANNTATNSSGGGISLQQSELDIKGSCIISGNYAMKGGGIHATSSTIAVHQLLLQPWSLQFINNRAENGSGVYLEINAKLYMVKNYHDVYYQSFDNDDTLFITFSDNCAGYGGAIYVADDTNCSPDNECFIQTFAIYQADSRFLNTTVIEQDPYILFSGNIADKQGANLFGGLLDRCIPSPLSEMHLTLQAQHRQSGIISYLNNISNMTTLDTISSLPVQVCFCTNESEPDCSYQPPTIKVKKGETFTVSLVAVDQVGHPVDANIIGSLSSDGGFSEGQQTQTVEGNCRTLTFNVYSPHDSEKVKLFADGPCGSSTLSVQHLDIEFANCACPVGFQPLDSDTRCECICDSQLSLFITDCNSTTDSIVKVNTNSWIAYTNITDPPGYIIHPHCPFDYCQPATKTVTMNLNLPNGADAQCAYDRSGVLCGACQEHLSLSLGSSRCLSCHNHWPAVLVIILLAAIIAGILLVTALLAFDITVDVGLINGFIFYANIVAANSAVYFPSSEPSLPNVLVAWMNLDIGIDVCFFDGLDVFTKTWLQLAFPVYIISLVVTLIMVSEHSPKFARLIGKRDPIATLATLILLSYAKLLSVTITALSFAVLKYPDGSKETVWLQDGNLKYFQGKHVALALVALSIILVGVPYTFLLFLWQWLVRVPEWKIFKWTRSTKLDAFVSVYHAPYNCKYRYWTGLLLIVRVILYITASATVSDKPQTSLLITVFLVGGLFLIKEITGTRMYKKSFVNIVETALYFNLIALSAFSWYDFRTDRRKQTVVAHTSTIITFLLLIGVIIYHVYLLVKKGRPQGEEVIGNEYAMTEVHQAVITHTSVAFPHTLNRYQPPEVRRSLME